MEMSLDTSMQLRVASVFIILVASAVGICFPLLVDTNNKMFRLLNAGSAGVMLGLALVIISFMNIYSSVVSDVVVFPDAFDSRGK